MNFWWQFLAVASVYLFATWGGQKAIERYLGRTSDSKNKIYAAGVRVAALVLIMVLPLQIWGSFDSSIGVVTATFTAFLVGDLAAQSLFGKRSTDLN